MSTLPVAVIPAYCPSGVLGDIVRDLLGRRLFSQVVVVNDGSASESASVFEGLRAMDGVVVLRHAVNLGKGAALKTAFNYVLLHFSDAPGVVTLDADGQHLTRDVEAICAQLRQFPRRVHLGVRQFDGDVPLRSRLGNLVTRRVFRLFIGKDVTDTQTGLRGIPMPLLPGLLKVLPNGYDYELEMLMRFVRTNVPIDQHAISTEYEPGNPSSHFNPLFDSFRIYFVGPEKSVTGRMQRRVRSLELCPSQRTKEPGAPKGPPAPASAS